MNVSGYWLYHLATSNQFISKMMIIPKSGAFSLQKLEKKVFKAFSVMLESTYKQVHLSLWIFLTELIIQTTFELGFHVNTTIGRLWNCPEVNNILIMHPYFTPPGVSAEFPLMYQITTSAMFAFILISTLCFIYIIFKQNPKKATLLFLSSLFRLNRILFRPIFGTFVYNTFSSNEAISIPSKVISGLSGIFMIIFLMVYTRLCFNAVPKDNPYYKLDTNYEYYTFCLVAIKSFFYYSQPITYSLILCILILDVVKEFSCQQYIASPVVRIFQRLPTQFGIINCLFVLLTRIITSTRPLFYFWVLSQILLIIYKWMMLPVFNSSYFELNNCVGNSRHDVCCFIRQEWDLRESNDTNKLGCYFGFLNDHWACCKNKQCLLIQNQETLREALINSDITEIQKQLAVFRMKFLKDNEPDDDLISTLYFIELYQIQSTKAVQNFKGRKKVWYQEFFIYHIQRLVAKELENDSYRITEENFTETKIAFLKQLRLAVEQYGVFFDELNSKKARLTILEKLGEVCFNHIEELKKLFLRLLENKMDLTIVSYYLQFVENLMGDKVQAEEISGRISKKITLQKYEDYTLEQSPHPTIQIDVKTGKLININLEAVKIIGMMKQQLYDKSISHFLLPNIDQDEWQDVFDKLLNSPVVSFCKNRQGNITVFRIHSRIKEISNKKKYYLQIIPLKCLYGQVYALINHDMTIQIASQTQVSINQNIIQFEDLFKQFIEPSWGQLLRNHNLKVECGQQANATISLYDTLGDDLECICVEIVYYKDTDTVESNNQKSTMQFCVCKEGDWIVMEGNKQSAFLGNGLKFDRMRHDAIDDLDFVNKLMQLDQVNYAKNIKSYRLDGERIFCIDLEEVNIAAAATDLAKTGKQNNQALKTCYSLGFLKPVLFISLSIFLSITIGKEILHRLSIVSITQMYTSYTRIETLELRFYWIANILRDVHLNQDPSAVAGDRWVGQVKAIIDQIQSSQTLKLFSDKIRTVVFKQITYSLDLDQIYDMVLAHLLQLLQTKDASLSVDISHLEISFLLGATLQEKQRIAKTIDLTLNTLTLVSWSACAGSVFLLIVFMGFLLLVEVTQIRVRSQILKKFLMMSDHEILSYRNRLTSFQNQLFQEERGIETEVFGTLLEEDVMQPRPTPKQLKISLVQKKMFLGLLLGLFVVGVSAFIYGVIFSNSKNVILQKCFEINTALADSYINFAYLAINAMQHSQTEMIDLIFSNLDTIQAQHGSMPFSDTFNNYIDLVYYQDFCSVVKSLYPLVDCSNTFPNTLFINPFEQGIVYFFHHAYFSLTDKFLEARSYVGVQAHPFIAITEDMISRTKMEWENIIVALVETETMSLSCYLIMNLICAIILNRFLADHRKKKVLVRNICKLVNTSSTSEPQNSPKTSEIKSVQQPTSRQSMNLGNLVKSTKIFEVPEDEEQQP